MWKGSSWLEGTAWRGGGDSRVIITRCAWWCRARPHLKTRRATFQPHSVLFFPFSLSGPHFASSYSFAHILLSGTSIDNPFSPTRSTSKHLPILTILFSFNRLECADLVILFFMSFYLFPCALLLSFHFIPCVIVCFGMHHILSKHVSAQEMHFMYRNMCMYKWAFVGTHEHTHMLGNIRNERWKNCFGIQHLLKCCAFFLGALCCAVIIFGVRCHVRISLWGIYFGNHGLNLGLTLFRLGTRMGLVI